MLEPGLTGVGLEKPQQQRGKELVLELILSI